MITYTKIIQNFDIPETVITLYTPDDPQHQKKRTRLAPSDDHVTVTTTIFFNTPDEVMKRYTTASELPTLNRDMSETLYQHLLSFYLEACRPLTTDDLLAAGADYVASGDTWACWHYKGLYFEEDLTGTCISSMPAAGTTRYVGYVGDRQSEIFVYPPEGAPYVKEERE